MLDDNQIINSEQASESTPEVDTGEVTESDNTEGSPDYLEIKYNKENIRVDRDKAVELAQKGMNYEKAIERARQEARDAYVAEQGYEWNGRTITTEAEYRQALREQELLESYQDKDIPEEIIQELVENKRFREQFEEERRQREVESNQQAEFQAFLSEYPHVKAEEIPMSVWEYVASGKSLIDAYTKYENQLLKQQLGISQRQEMIQQKNQQNAMSSVGAIKSNGSTSPFYSRDQVSKMSREEINTNWKVINESMKKW